MDIIRLKNGDKEWNEALEYIENCPWEARKSLARKMKENYFSDWQCVFIIKKDNEIVAFCTFTKEDGGIEAPNYCPYIGYVYTDEKARGNRLSEKLIEHCMEYASSLGFESVYIVTGHKGLYEKFGFEFIDRKPNKKGDLERIYCKSIR